MDDLTAEPKEQSGRELHLPHGSAREGEIRKWRAMARMVHSFPDVLPFSHVTTDPERRWAFFGQASGIFQQLQNRAFTEVTGGSEAAIEVY